MKYKNAMLLLSAGLVVSSCTVERIVEKEVPVSTQTPATAPSAPSRDYTMSRSENEDAVIDFVIETYGSLPNSRASILETAYLVCDSLREGFSVEEIGQMIQDASETQDAVNYLAAISAGAIGYLCPEFMPEDI